MKTADATIVERESWAKPPAACPECRCCNGSKGRLDFSGAPKKIDWQNQIAQPTNINP